MSTMESLNEYGRATDQAGNEQVIIGRYPVKVIGSVNAQNLARFQGKITTGEYSFDSDPTISAYSMASFAGGMGNLILKEGVDDDTYWTATMETRHPHILCNLPKTWVYGEEIGASVAKGIGDFPASAPQFYAAFGTSLRRWNTATETFDAVGILPAIPVGNGKGVEFNDKLFIPCGSAGIATAATGGSIDSVSHADIHAIALTIYDNKVAAITTEGHLRIMRLDETWEPLADAMKLPSGHVPTGILTFINQQQEPAIHVITNRDVWAYDRDNVTLMRTHLQYPKHPQQGRASTVWRGDSIYVSVGIGIHSYTGNTIAAMGPDGRYGLPAELRGYITDLEQEYNGLLALVQGAGVVGSADEHIVITPPQYQDDEPAFPEVNARSVLLRWNQRYWHPVWESEAAGGLPTNVLVSDADGNYRLWWGFNGQMHMQRLPLGFSNPKVGMQVGEDEFAARGTLTTGWFDADMLAFEKLASHIELVIADVFENGTPLGEVTIRYQIDQESAWSTLRTVSDVGRFVLPFGTVEREDGTTFSAGTPFTRIRFRIESTSLSERITPLIQNILFKYIKLPISQFSWNFSVDLANNEGFSGVSNEELRDYLIEKAYSREFLRFVHRDQTYRVRIAQTSGADMTGLDDRSTLTLNVIEVKIPPDDLSGQVTDLSGYTGYGD